MAGARQDYCMKSLGDSQNVAGVLKLFANFSRKAGMPPGSLVPVGKAIQEHTRIQVFAYDEHECSERADCSLDQIEYPGKVIWINIDGLSDVALLEAIGRRFGIHDLVLEDMLNTDQRPKFEEHERHIFAVLKMMYYGADGDRPQVEQVSVIAGDRYVISVQEREGDVFNAIRDRIRSSRGQVRKRGADYLFYCLMDAIVDNYFSVLERFGEQIESLDAYILERPEGQTFESIHALRNVSLVMRRSVWPVREVVNSFLRTESTLVTADTRLYIRDVYDHALSVVETLEALRDLLSSVRDVYLSSLSNRMNEIMKVLTIIATIFIPLSFIAGLYGMNFKHMPELEWQWGYPTALMVMAAVGVGLLAFFRKKKWI